MEKIKFTLEQVEAVYDDVDRRVYMMAQDGDFDNIIEVVEYRNAVLQGVYSAFVTQAKNWPAVSQWCSRIEEERYTEERKQAGRI